MSETRLGRARGLRVALVTRIGGRGLVFLVALVLARELGADGYGIYSYATTWAGILVLLSGLGFDQVLLKQTATYSELGRSDLLRKVLKRTERIVLALAATFSILGAVVAFLFLDPIFLIPLAIVLPLVGIRAFSLVWEGVLQGLGRTDESFLATYVIYPLLMLGGVLLLVFVNGSISTEEALVVYVLAFCVGAIVVRLVGGKRLRPVVERPSSDLDVGPEKVPLIIPFTAFSFLTIAESGIGILLLGFMDLPQIIGELQLSIKLVEPISLVILVIGISLASRIAAEAAKGSLQQAQAEIGRNVLLGFALAAMMGFGVIVFREPLIELFGEDFAGASSALLILGLAAIFNVATGVSGPALMMAGKSPPAIGAKTVGLALNVVICLILIPKYGAAGAAVGLAASIVVGNTLMAGFAYKMLGLDTTPLAFVRTRAGSHREAR